MSRYWKNLVVFFLFIYAVSSCKGTQDDGRRDEPTSGDVGKDTKSLQDMERYPDSGKDLGSKDVQDRERDSGNDFNEKDTGITEDTGLPVLVLDEQKAVEAVENVEGALYTLLQMAARNFIGGVSVDGLLEAREGLSEALFKAMVDDAKSWGIEILRADLKDVILPGDMKSILNQVIFAEKKAQANLITRREETAATRSLANTAKMYEKNPMLLRLKELDAMQTMVSNAENLTIVTSKDKILDIV